MSSAVVFAYHDVGVRCLAVLMAHDVRVKLVVTHRDNPDENIWFGSVAELATLHDLPVVYAEDMDDENLFEQVGAAAPDFIFSFYCRRMLPARLLGMAVRGAYNMHGSLLPKYRGRVPVNWAVLKGERETGATLHQMVEKPDAGPIVGRQAVPILPDDTAVEVFRKVTLAAECVLDRSLPALLGGTAELLPQELSGGSYFGGRKPEDGQIDWRLPAVTIHNLVRAVAPPYPGAFCRLADGTLRVLRTLVEPSRTAGDSQVGLYVEGNRLYADCADGKVLRLVEAEYSGERLGAEQFAERFGTGKILLT